MFAIGMAIDYSNMLLKKSELQFAVDAAAVAVGHELRLANANPNQVQDIAKTSILENLNGNTKLVSVHANVTSSPTTISISVSQEVGLNFMSRFSDGVIAAKASAQVLGGSPICVLGLDDDKKKAAITLEESARITGNRCAIYSNATGKKSLVSKDGARMQADFICTSGGVDGQLMNFAPRPLTDCPQVPDPLVARTPPSIGSCTYNNVRYDVEDKFKIDDKSIDKWIKEETKDETDKKDNRKKASKDWQPRSAFTERTVTLKPGVYCGGLSVGGAVQVNLLPGTYIIKDGPLYVGNYASLKGEHVGFYFSGDKSNLYFGPDSVISLTAPKNGAMAGLLFFEDRDRPKLKPYAILSDNAHVLEGTIYFPQSRFYIDADNVVADQSAYTAIVARRLDLYKGPNLVLNTDYDLTDVPVPDGIARNGRIILTE